jgi:hypothetical protein|tara:strand:- start:409 stop:591 length:183 start_codon:yes stop_codon:yes gene_type:complete
MENLNLIKDIKKKDDEIKELKLLLYEIYNILQHVNITNDVNIIKLTFGSIKMILKELLDI